MKSFHQACHLNDTNAEEEKDVAESVVQRYKILNSAVFNDLMLFALKDMCSIFDKHLKRGQKGNKDAMDEEEEDEEEAAFHTG